MSSLSTILPFIRPLEPLLADPDVTEVMVNAGGRRVFVERSGRLHPTDVVLDERLLKIALKNIARTCGDEISESRPILEAKLEDGSRVAAMLPPCAVDGPILTIRKFGKRYSVEDLIRAGTLTEAHAEQLAAAVQKRKNILISGGSGTGKTTLLNALAAKIHDDERIIVIEETSEIAINKPNVLRLQATESPASLNAESRPHTIQLGDLVRTALRHRPDRIIVGEVRGPEAWDLLQALNTGHAGSLSTIHANSAEHALVRFADCVMTARFGLPHDVVRQSISAATHVVVHLCRDQGHRRVAQPMAL
jgi:pilus assembly protein CpaF